MKKMKPTQVNMDNFQVGDRVRVARKSKEFDWHGLNKDIVGLETMLETIEPDGQSSLVKLPEWGTVYLRHDMLELIMAPQPIDPRAKELIDDYRRGNDW